MIPGPWEFALLALAAWRCWWLLSEDDILNRWRERIHGRWPRLVEDFVGCPFCAGAWIAVGWWAAWYLLSDKWVTVAAVPFALAAAVPIVAVAVRAYTPDN